KEIKNYTSELQSLIASLRETTSITNEIIKKKYLIIASDTSRPFFPPVAEQEVPFIDFSPLENAVTNLGRATDHISEISSKKGLTRIQTDSLNRLLYHAEQELL